MTRYGQEEKGQKVQFEEPGRGSQRLSTSSVSDLDMTPSMRCITSTYQVSHHLGADWTGSRLAGPLLMTVLHCMGASHVRTLRSCWMYALQQAWAVCWHRGTAGMCAVASRGLASAAWQTAMHHVDVHDHLP